MRINKEYEKEIKNKIKMTTKKVAIEKIIIVLVCFSVFLTLASASLYEDFGEFGCCVIDDYGKTSLSSSLNKFTTINCPGGSGDPICECGSSACTFLLDYAPFEIDTIDLVGEYSFYYGEILHIVEGDADYFVLLGESESALEEVVDLVANYNNHEVLLRGDYATFYSDSYFRLDDAGIDFEYPQNSNCTDNPSANRYTGNQGSSGRGENLTSFSSSCTNENLLEFYYCDNDELMFQIYQCKCNVDRCVADVSDVFYWLSLLGDGEITSYLAYSAVESWINDVESVVPLPPPGSSTGSRESSGGGGGAGTPTSWASTVEINTEQFNSGYTRQLGGSQRVKVKVEDKNHYIGVIDLTETTTTVEVSSEPQKATLSIGDERKFEVTNDNFYDINVKLNSIVGGEASLTIKSIYEEIPTPVAGCNPDWECTGWSNCIGEEKIRTCTDSNECGTDGRKPDEITACGTGTAKKRATNIMIVIIAGIMIIIGGIAYLLHKKRYS